MTIRELYQTIGSDFDDVLARIPNEKLIGRLVKKFLQEGSMTLLTESMKAGEKKEALTAVHTMKGLALNLGFTVLGRACTVMNEALKEGRAEDPQEMYQEVLKAYDQVVSLIEECEV